jgi:endo-1,4-beta-mannosidase
VRCAVLFRNTLTRANLDDVKLIIPMINQCTGKHSNWVGDVVDLCCLRHNCGYDEGRKTTFWSDRAVIDSFKQLITVYLNRVNTINGRRYGSDPTVLAWETGNEMNFEGLGKTPAPGAWTVEIAEHIKSLAPDTLVMDGSYARNDSSDCKSCYAPEVLASPAVELLTYHFYNDEEGTRAPK